MTILLNENFVAREDISIDIEDRGYQFGDGIYEVVRVYKGKPFLIDEHLKRFERSANEIRLNLQFTNEELKNRLHKLVELNDVYDGIIYFQATRGNAPRSHSFPNESKTILIAYTNEVERPEEDIEHGVKIVTIEDIRWLRCDIKSLNLLGNVLAKQYAIDNNAKEAIQIRNQFITEGSASNFFIIKNEKIYTHPANNYILRGITRDLVEKIAKQLNIPFYEKKFTLSEALESDEVFITGTTSEVLPVIQIDDIKINKEPGPITRKLQTEYLKLI